MSLCQPYPIRLLVSVFCKSVSNYNCFQTSCLFLFFIFTWVSVYIVPKLLVYFSGVSLTQTEVLPTSNKQLNVCRNCTKFKLYYVLEFIFYFIFSLRSVYDVIYFASHTSVRAYSITAVVNTWISFPCLFNTWISFPCLFLQETNWNSPGRLQTGGWCYTEDIHP